MKIKVTGQSIAITDKYLTVSDTENVYEVEYEFDDEWDGYSKTACFKGADGTIYSVILDSTLKCNIPNEVVADSGYIWFGVLGTKTVDTTTMRYPTIWSERMFVDVACASGSTPPDPTPSVYAQILSAYQEMDGRMDTAESDIDTLQESAHTHSNKSILDTITQALVTAWTTASNWITANGTNVLSHLLDTTIHTTSSEKATWNGKSTVSVSATGEATDEVEYITVDGVEKKIKGGTSGTTDFEQLTNRPKYNGSVMTGDTNIPEVPSKTSDLTNDGDGTNPFLTQHQSLSSYRTSAAQDIIDATKADASTTYTKTEVDNELADKVDKVTGKGLSTNDYDATEKQKVQDAYDAKHSHSNKSTLDSITGIDSVVTSGSNKLITSGAVYTVVGNIESLLEALR